MISISEVGLAVYSTIAIILALIGNSFVLHATIAKKAIRLDRVSVFFKEPV